MSKQSTHTEVARDYTIQHRDDTIYTRGQWYRYGAGVWEALNDNEFNREIWHLLEKWELRDLIRPTAAIHASVIKYLQSELYIEERCVDAKPNLINMANGVYDLELGSLLTHNRQMYLTTQLPFSYDVNADCPTWEFFLTTSLVHPDWHADPELIEFMQEAIGYSLTTDVRYHASFWCLGEGANGKGVLFHVLEKLGGTAATPFNVNLLRKEQYQLANLAGKRIALCSEANATDNLVEDAVVKQLIAGDSMTVRQIRREPFTLYPQIKLWWAMNRLPAVADTSKGFWRRVRIVPFNRTFEEDEQIRDLKEKLDDELPGIFNWAMRGLQRLEYQGEFTTPKQVTEATNQYMRESNNVLMYIEDNCIADNPNDWIQAEILYKDYCRWCYENGYKSLSTKRFKHELESLNIFSTRVAAGNIYKGVRLRV